MIELQRAIALQHDCMTMSYDVCGSFEGCDLALSHVRVSVSLHAIIVLISTPAFP